MTTQHYELRPSISSNLLSSSLLRPTEPRARFSGVMKRECDSCCEEINDTDKFCPDCGYEQGLVSWDWKECPDWGVIESKINAINGPVKIEEVNQNDDQHYVRIISA